MCNDPGRPSQYPLPSWSSATPPSHEFAPVSQYPPPPQSAPSYHYPPPTTDMTSVQHLPHHPPPMHMQSSHPPDSYRLPPPPGPYQRPPVEYYGPAPPVAPPQVVYQAAAPRQRTAIACRYCRRRKIRCSGFDSSADGRCSNCVRFNQECMFTPVSSQTQAFVPAQAAYPHLRSMTMPQGQNVPPPGRLASRPTYAAEGVMLYGAYGQPLSSPIGGPPPQPQPPTLQTQVSLASPPGAPGPLPPQSEADGQPMYAHAMERSVPSTTAPTGAYQPTPPPLDYTSRKRSRPDDFQAELPVGLTQKPASSASPIVQSQAARPTKARPSSTSTSVPPEQSRDRRNTINGSQTTSSPSYSHKASPAHSHDIQSAPPASPHPGGSAIHNAQLPPSTQPIPLGQIMTAPATTSTYPPPVYTAPAYPGHPGYYSSPPPHHVGQQSHQLAELNTHPAYMYDQRNASHNGYALPPQHMAQPNTSPYPPITALPLHSRPPHSHQQLAPPTHPYPPGSQAQSQSQAHASSSPRPVVESAPQPPYSPSSTTKGDGSQANAMQNTQGASQPDTAVLGTKSEQPSSQREARRDSVHAEHAVTPPGTSQTKADATTSPQQVELPATLQPSAKATPVSANSAIGGPGSTGNSCGRGLSVLDLCGPDSSGAPPVAKARSTTDSDMLNALSRKV